MKKQKHLITKNKNNNEFGITEKKMKFVNEYLVDLNLLQAALRAGYTPKTAKVASRFLEEEGVQRALKSRMNDRIERVEIDQDLVIEKIQEMVIYNAEKVEITTKFDIIKRMRDAPVALKGLEMLGKHFGMFVDKTDNDSKVTVVIKDFTGK